MIAEHDNLDTEALFNKVMGETINECEKIFSAEEGNGKYMDLNVFY